MRTPKILLLTAPGLYGARDYWPLLRHLGASPQSVALDDLRAGKAKLMSFAGLVIPGGSSYEDVVGAGQILGGLMRFWVEELRRFIAYGRAVLAVGNGFQALVKCGILPAFSSAAPTAGFAPNDSGRFEARWVHVRLNTQSHSPFFEGLPEMMELPVFHREGKIILKSPKHLEEIKKNKSIAMQYVSDDGKLAGYPANPNGSIFNLAALSNPQGNCLGLMPHPERFTSVYHHPNWTRQTFRKPNVGLELVRKVVEYAARA
jgi:phosphoribosylformylglycinamidine synthase